jgi:acetyl esterase/lipase
MATQIDTSADPHAHESAPASSGAGSAAGADLDPEIRRFIALVGAGFAQYPPLDSLSFPGARRVAELVRAPWAAGGPVMARTFERLIPTATGELRARFHEPHEPSPRPALIYLHGGGWTLFSIDTHDRVMREYAARAGIVVVGLDYPLSPEVRFPLALEQIAAAVLWIGEHGSALGIDPARIAIGGDSAGGNLSMATCLRLRDQGHGMALTGLLLNYAVFDRECSADAQRRYGGEGYMLASGEMDGFWHNYLGEDAEAAEAPLACPIRAQLEGLPPALLVIPECDLLAEQGVRMAERLRAAGVPVEARIYRGASHSFLEAVSMAALSQRAFDESASWLRSLLETGA